MSTPSRPYPDPSEPVNWQEMWTAQRAALHETQRHHDRLLELISALEEPAQMETIILTPQAPTEESRERFQKPTLSVGVYNPNNFNIYFSGIGSAGPQTRSPTAPPNSLIVLPIRAAMIELAASPTDLAGNNAVVFLLRYFTVQPAFLGQA